jgi:hypothetical protein
MPPRRRRKALELSAMLGVEGGLMLAPLKRKRAVKLAALGS